MPLGFEKNVKEGFKMPKITLDGKEYDTEKLPKEAVDLINSIQFVDNEIAKLQNQIKVHLSARNFYILQLKQVLSKEENSTEEVMEDDKVKF